MSANGARNHCKDVEVWTDAIQRLCIAEGNMDQPVLLHVNVGEPQRADGASREHATYSMSFESYMLNTGSFSRDGKVDGK
jgi:hypothetical protein